VFDDRTSYLAIIYSAAMRPWFVLLAACGGPAGTPDADAPAGDGRVHVDDGTPVRQPCTSSFGSALSGAGTYGRLDGFLVAIVPPGGGACNADSTHVHLQIRMSGAIYDVAVDVSNAMTGQDDVHSKIIDHDITVTVPWAEGWHTGLAVNYSTLGVHTADLPLVTKAALVTQITDSLATANHISVYAITYGSDGVHLVHRNGGGGSDGLIVTEPLSTPSHLRLLSFSDQVF
jgi:hypothetical protein